jgi:CBS domain-containing protein
VTREYAIDPFEVLFVRDVMHSSVVVVPAQASAAEVSTLIDSHAGRSPLFPLVEKGDRFAGLVTRRQLERWLDNGGEGPVTEVAQTTTPVTAFADEPLGIVLNRMANTGFTRLPVLSREQPRRLEGMLTLTQTLKAKRRHLEEESRRERVNAVDLLVPAALRRRGRRRREQQVPAE